MHSLTWTHVATIAAALIGAAVLGRVIGHLVAKLACRLVRLHANDNIRARVASGLRGPISLVLTLAIWQIAVAFFDLPDDVRATLHDIARVGLVLALVWAALRIANLVV